MKTATTSILFSFFLFTISATAQTYPDNVMDSDCFTEPESMVWAIDEGNSSINCGHMYALPLVGDIDNDGHSEVVFMNDVSPQHANGIVILNDQLNLKHQISIPEAYVYGGYPLAIADVDRDGIAEIFIYISSINTLRCYNFNGTASSVKWNATVNWSNNRSTLPAIADINGDNIPEIVVFDKVFNAQTGDLLLTLPTGVGMATAYNSAITYMPVLADMDNDGMLEVVGGNNVIKVTITNTTGTSGNSGTIWKTITGNNVEDGWTSVADIDMDGFLDVVVVKTYNLYAWSPYSGSGSTPQILGSQYYSAIYNSTYNGSRAMIADIDNDNVPEIVWSSSCYIQAVRYNTANNNFDLLWTHSTTDLSGATSMTAFDFNQDGQVEIVYRDQNFLRIIDGTTGLNITTFSCPSGTATEYPVIVDLDRDGEAEILVSESMYETNQVRTSRIRSFKSPDGSRWAPARYVWNQHGYSVVHINNDLTVPTNNFNPATTFTTTSGDVIRPFNNFLQQATTINQFGEPFFGLPDLTFIDGDNAIQVENYCDSMKITFCITNIGNAPCAAPIHSTLLAGDENGMGMYVHTCNEPIGVDDTVCFSFVVTQDLLKPYMPVNQFTLVINSSSSTPNEECDYENNILSFPFSLEIAMDFEGHICTGSDFSGHGFTIPTASIPTAGTYTFTQNHSNENGCDTLLTLTLHVHDATEVEISAEACNEYRYNNILYTESGTYTFDFVTAHGCDSTVILHLTIHSLDVRIISEKEDFCEEYFTTLSVELSSPALLQWSTGETTPSINVEQTGIYSVTASSGNCMVTSSITIPECDFSVYIPNAISPSKPDGTNDIFFIPWKINPDAISFEISIYDRWGVLVFYSKNPYFRWDGSFKGKIAHNITYNYIIRLQKGNEETQTIKGTILVL
ncbi:FG-GAP-like repeat-containing protein [Bacteroidales bacterium OttesenSCG-928-B11]|nr:FG-GAP-like repeat-containing protein [Bacteroidales bacterium OttesenSCG-928-E04]MDL2308929.1 FG-GAP-like repeat-containing protein [Bacteroidales bacterium OttesenSCG-928-C03]MDL2312700.1 FG-GAP-like repeat-containing protein [Bacteroidales bacterium OttesenSCG-928-B11]MDL2326260.1 FG-GAP-like repeat-containing protein [Bacteroidales bacterium OttesenSCG-928-A14]